MQPQPDGLEGRLIANLLDRVEHLEATVKLDHEAAEHLANCLGQLIDAVTAHIARDLAA